MYMKKCSFWLYFNFNCSGFAENSYLSFYIYLLKMFILNRSVYNYAQIEAKLLGQECNFFVYFVFYWRDISESSVFSLHTFSLQTTQVLL